MSADAPEAEMIWLEVTAREKMSMGWAMHPHQLLFIVSIPLELQLTVVRGAPRKILLRLFTC